MTWEFLEAKNEELAAKLGMSPLAITLREPPPNPLDAPAYESTGFNPKLVAILDEDEAAFMVALVLVNRRYVEQTYPNWKPGHARMHNRRARLFPNVFNGCCAAALLVYAAFGHPDPFMQVLIAISIPAFLFIMTPWFANLMARRMRKTGALRFDFSHIYRPRFFEAAALTGNPQAGERYIRKSVILKDTSWAQEKLGEDAHTLAKRAYDSCVPPEYQVPNAV